MRESAIAPGLPGALQWVEMMKHRIAARMTMVVLVLGACSSAPPATPGPSAWDGRDTSRTFTVSSETSSYMVRGTLTGELHLTSTSLVVVVTGGQLISFVEQPRVGVRAIAATQGPAGWMPELMSDMRDFGALEAMQPKTIEEPAVFRIELPTGFHPEEYWLAFEFMIRSQSGPGVSTTYACSERNILGPDSLSAERAAAMRADYVAAC